jgi:30S ribosomal protein S31
MGKGDKKSKKGKQAMGSYGNSRPKKAKNLATAITAKIAAKTEKK